MKSIFVLLCVVIALSVLGGCDPIQHSHVLKRQVYAYWSTCDDCICHNISVSAYETKNQVETYAGHLYYVHNINNFCENTWTMEWSYGPNPLSNLNISPSGQLASLYVSDIIDSAGHNIKIDLAWVIPDDNNIAPPINFRSDNQSQPHRAKVIGSLFVDQLQFTVDTNADGQIH